MKNHFTYIENVSQTIKSNIKAAAETLKEKDDQCVVTWFFLKDKVMELKDMETPEAEAIDGERDLSGEGDEEEEEEEDARDGEHEECERRVSSM